MKIMAVASSSSSPRRLVVTAGSPPLVRGPPASYDHRKFLLQKSKELVGKQHPGLLELVQQGTLVALERPADYRERRSDGYEEPLQIFLVGTAHVSPQSAADVRRVVAAVQPDAVVVELCRSRQAVMYPPAAAATAAAAAGQQQGAQPQQQQQQQQQQATAEQGTSAPNSSSSSGSSSSIRGLALQSVGSGSASEEDDEQLPSSSSSSSGGGGGSTSTSSGLGSTSGSGSGRGPAGTAAPGPNLLSLSGAGLLPAFQRSMELGGASALLLRLLLSRLSARLAGSLGVQGGGEFVAAREEAEVLGAQLVLGDRPIEITLQRAWDALSWRQRVQLGAELADGLLSVQQGSLDGAAVERLKDDDAVSLLFSALSQQYPELVAPLIHERDLYLAWSLKRSKAVNGARAVVGVVGKGHLRGVCYALTHDAAGAQLRFRDLVGGKNVKADRARQRAAAAGRFALETAALGAAWWAWTALQQ